MPCRQIVHRKETPMPRVRLLVGEERLNLHTQWGAYIIIPHPNGHAIEVHPATPWRRVVAEDHSDTPGAIVLHNEDRKG